MQYAHVILIFRLVPNREYGALQKTRTLRQERQGQIPEVGLLFVHPLEESLLFVQERVGHRVLDGAHQGVDALPDVPIRSASEVEKRLANVFALKSPTAVARPL